MTDEDIEKLITDLAEKYALEFSWEIDRRYLKSTDLRRSNEIYIIQR